MRDHKKLQAFRLADELTVEVYRTTKTFPRDELFGLTAQVRRAAVSVPSNVVEGCARHTEADYLHFLDMAHGSAHELEYQLSLAFRLGYLPEKDYSPLKASSGESCRVLTGLIRSLRHG